MKLSVVMSVYNGEEFLMESIQSILAQTHSDFEFVIVNDGSTDGTKGMIGSIIDSRIRVFHLDKNRGLSFGLNYGIEQATGDWIVRQDADDISLPKRIEEQIKYLKADPRLVGVSSLIRCIPGKLPIKKEVLRDIEGTNGVITRKQMMVHRFLAPPFIHGSVTFSKDAFLKSGRYDESYLICQDHDLWIRMLDIGPFEKVKKVLYEYRVSPDSLGHRNESATCDEVLRLCTKNIHNRLLKQLQREPRFTILGSIGACDYLRKFISPKGKLIVRDYFYDLKKTVFSKVYSDFMEGKIDAVIVLDCPQAEEAIFHLQQSGMQLSINLFKVWNVF